MEPFNLPIYYINDKIILDKNLIADLEIIKTNDNNNTNKNVIQSDNKLNLQNNKPLYHFLFNPKTKFENDNINLWSEYYTNNKQFLKDSQKLYKYHNKNNTFNTSYDYLDIYDVWDNIITINNDNDCGFTDKYNYIEWDKMKFLNNNSTFLQFWSLYNMTSPILSLSFPILFLIMPFFILKLQKIQINLSTYISILKQVASRHQIGQLLSFSSVSWDKRVYIIISLIFYIIQIYFNTSSCIRFFRNINYITDEIDILNSYFNHTINNIELLYYEIKDLPSYQKFTNNMIKHKEYIIEFNSYLETICNLKLFYKKVLDIGNIMCMFYKIYNKSEIINSIEYSLKLNAYISNINNISYLLKNKKINICKFSKNTCKFKDAYYPVIKNPIKNSYDLNKHILITGPNAAGKTTLLKTTIYNIILSQQIGCGYYKNASITLFDNIHCYINIPDTSGRDSLFQAEARRCKNILDNIVLNNKTKKISKHFCIFDELFSGTNPYEAISSAFSYLKYLSKYNNVNIIITTHYIELCNKLLNHKKFINKHMNINNTNNNYNYTYLLKDGISNVKGGIKVLNDLKYPLEIINETNNIINNINI